MNIFELVGGTALTAAVVVLASAQLMLLISAVIELRHVALRERHHVWGRAGTSTILPKVTVVIPAYNEELSISESTKSILALTYPNLEVVVVIDGGSDNTLGELQKTFELVPVHPIYQHRIDTQPVSQMYRSVSESTLLVVDKANGGKADAMNCGLNTSTGELICFIDADTLIAPDALQKLAVPFIDDEEVVASGGMVRHSNGAVIENGIVTRLHAPRHPLAAAQAVEYIRAFIVGRLGWNKLGGNLLISGAFGLFRRDKLLEIGGYEHETIGEDMELVVRLRRLGYEESRPAKVVFMTAACSWTEVPESLASLSNQRGRWYRGLIDVLIRHKKMLFRPTYGAGGMLGMPYYLIVEFLAPLLEALGIVILFIAAIRGQLTGFTLMIVACAYMAGLLITTSVLLLDELANRTYSSAGDRFRLVLAAIFEQTIVHVATVVWRINGLIDAMRGRSDWGTMTRKGFGSS